MKKITLAFIILLFTCCFGATDISAQSLDKDGCLTPIIAKVAKADIDPDLIPYALIKRMEIHSIYGTNMNVWIKTLIDDEGRVFFPGKAEEIIEKLKVASYEEGNYGSCDILIGWIDDQGYPRDEALVFCTPLVGSGIVISLEDHAWADIAVAHLKMRSEIEQKHISKK